VWATGATIANVQDATGAWEAYDGAGVEPEAWAAGTNVATQNQVADDTGMDGDQEPDNWPVDDADDALTNDWFLVDHDGAVAALADLEEGDDEEADLADDAAIADVLEEPEVNSDDPEESGAWTTVPRYGLRAQRTRDYSHRLAQQMDASTSGQSYDPQHQLLQTGHRHEHAHFVFGHVMTQMTATAGIKKHGQRAIDALLKEFSQLDDKSVFAAVDAGTLATKQKKGALRAINLIKEKLDGALKGRSCADGRPQRALYTKEQAASPTVSTDALMISLMIDAKERRDVATADVVGAYLLVDMDEYVLLKLTGNSVDIICTVNSEYNFFVVIENGVKVLYQQLLKALYGCVQSALLWYELFSGTLKEMGFELNPYNLCIANKMIEGNLCNIAWYADDNKISHVKESVVTDVITAIEKSFGKMTVTRGKQHVFSVDIMCMVNLEYIKIVVIENGVKVLYQQLLKALYGCVRSALLW
jgi:hypothetical protein